MSYTKFRAKNDKLNWRNISSLHLSNGELQESQHFEEIVRNIVHSKLEEEDKRVLQSSRMIKLFLMNQTLIEFLLNIQEKLYKQNISATQNYSKLERRDAEHRRLLEENKNEIEILRGKRKLLESTTRDLKMLKRRLYAKSCPYCEKSFCNMDYLENHLINKHSYEIRQAKEEELRKTLNDKQHQEYIKELVRKQVEGKYEAEKSLLLMNISELERQRNTLSEDVKNANHSKDQIEAQRRAIALEIKTKEDEINRLRQSLEGKIVPPTPPTLIEHSFVAYKQVPQRNPLSEVVFKPDLEKKIMMVTPVQNDAAFEELGGLALKRDINLQKIDNVEAEIKIKILSNHKLKKLVNVQLDDLNDLGEKELMKVYKTLGNLNTHNLLDLKRRRR